MTGNLLLGVDVGTYSTKGVLCTVAGEVLRSATVEHGLSLPRPGWAEHDADSIWWGEFVQVTRALLEDGYSGDDVGAVAVSAIGACMLPVDTAGRPLRQGVLYGIDTRATAEIEELNAQFGEEAIFALSGMALTTQSIGPKILWVKRNEPDVFAGTHKFLTATSYMVFRLTGEYVIDRHTASYFSPLFDIEQCEWSDDLNEPICSLEQLPGLLWSDEIAGSVTREAAEATGLRVGTPVTAGTVDAAAEALSVGVENPGDMMIMYGTTMFFILVTDRPVPDPRMWATAFVFPGLYDVAGGMATTGALTRWFRDELGGVERAEEAAGGENAYQALARKAGDIPAGSDGLICLPYFSGERTPINDPRARGMFAGLTLSHTRGHLYRAVLEGTAYGVRHNLEAISGMGARTQRLVAVGGGAQNQLWMQIVSNVTGMSQIVPDRTIGACYGDAFLAGLGSGLITDRSALQQEWVTIRQVVEPDESAGRVYGDYYPIYRDLYENTREQQHRLADLG